MGGKYGINRFLKEQPETEDDWKAIRVEATQLFTPRTPIKLKNDFNGRKAQVAEVSDAILQAGGHAIIYGEPGVGKSSTAEVLHFFLSGIGKSLYSFPIQADSSDDFSTLWRKVFEEISLRYELASEQIFEDILDLFRLDDASPNDVRRSFELIFKQSDMPIIIVDEFNEIKDASTRMLIANTVKLLSDRGTNATLVLVGIAEDVSELIENYGSVERAISQVHMPRMRQDDLEEIIESRISQLGMDITEGALSKIVDLSKGLPAYVHNLGQHSVRNACHRKSMEVSERDVDLAIELVIKQMGQTALRAYNKATHSNHAKALHRHVLLACALVPTDQEGYFKPQDICQPLAEIIGRNVSVSTFQRHLPDLASDDRGAILACKGTSRKKRYRFKKPIMQPYTILKSIQDGLLNSSLKSLLSSSL